MTMTANSHPYRVTAVEGSSKYANNHPIKVLIEGGVVTPEQFEELEKKVDALATDLSYKGGVPTYNDLPADPEQGDVYTVEDTGVLYVWDGDEWVALNDSKKATTGSSDPTSSTEGELGQLYLNTTSGELFYCSATGDTYTWVSLDSPIQSISVNGTAVTPDANKNVDLTIPAFYKEVTGATFDTRTAEPGGYILKNNGSTITVTRPAGSTYTVYDGDRLIVLSSSRTLYLGHRGLYPTVLWGSTTTGNIDRSFELQTVNRLSSTSEVSPLSANMGKTLNDTKADKTAFTGTDGTAAGVMGLVPAPTTTDAGKFLKADGTWGEAGGGGGGAQSDYDQSNSAADDYIKNRKFYDGTTYLCYGEETGTYEYIYEGNLEPTLAYPFTELPTINGVSFADYKGILYWDAIAGSGGGSGFADMGDAGMAAYDEPMYWETPLALTPGSRLTRTKSSPMLVLRLPLLLAHSVNS